MPPLPGPFSLGPASASGPRLNRSECISVPRGLQPATKQPATDCLCLSVCPTPRPARNKAVPWGVSAGVQGLVSSGEQSRPGRRGPIFSSSGLGCRWGPLESEPQDCLPSAGMPSSVGDTPQWGSASHLYPKPQRLSPRCFLCFHDSFSSLSGSLTLPAQPLSHLPLPPSLCALYCCQNPRLI